MSMRTREEIENAVRDSMTLSDVIRKLNLPENGKSLKKVRLWSSEYGIDLSTLNAQRKNQERRKYRTMTKSCPICGTTFDAQIGHPREKTCCSRLCANKFYASPKSEIDRMKIKMGVNNYLIRRGKKSSLDERKKKHQIRQSLKRKSFPFGTDEYREYLRQKQLEKVKNGTHKGWKTRKGKKPSYPEQFFITVLENNGISYERECSCGKYFIDFAIHNKKIALEIDGKQHLWEERKLKDKEKDEFLASQGWKVYRILWKSINNDLGKIYIEGEINKFLELYHTSVA